MRRSPSLNPDHVDVVDVALVCGFVEPIRLAAGEVGGLVDDDAGRLVAMGAAVFGEGVQEEASGVSEREVGLAVVLGDLCGAATDNDSVATLVEDLGDSGV